MSLNRNASPGTKVLVGVAVFLIVFGLARTKYLPLTREGRRLARVDAAAKHAETVGPLIAKQERFVGVRVSEWYSGDGFFLVSGYVENEADMRDLRSIVESSKPPAPIAWEVQIAGRTNKSAETK